MRDQLPEQTGYRDDGCQVHSSWLSRPLPACIYEERYGVREGRLSPRRANLRARDMEIVGLAGERRTAREIGDTYGLTRGQVFRILAIEKNIRLELGNPNRPAPPRRGA